MYVLYICGSSDLASTIKMSYIWPFSIITCLALLLCIGVCMCSGYIHGIIMNLVESASFLE